MERSNQGVRPPGRRRRGKKYSSSSSRPRPSRVVTRANAEVSSSRTGLTRRVGQLQLQGTTATARNENHAAAAAAVVARTHSTEHENGSDSSHGGKQNLTQLRRLLENNPSLEEVQSLVRATPKVLFTRDARGQFPVHVALSSGKYGQTNPNVVAYLHRQYPIPVLKALVNTISTCGNTQTAKQAVAAWLENATMRNQHSSPEVQLAKELVDELQKDSPYGSQQALILCALLDLNDSSFTRTSQRVGKSHKVAYFTFVRDTAKHLFEVSFDEFRYVNMTFLGQGGLKVVEKGNPVHPERRNEEAVVIWDLEESCYEELNELDIYCKLNVLNKSCFLRVHDVTMTSHLHQIRTSIELANLGDAGYYVASHDMSIDRVQSVFAQVLLALQLAYDEIDLIHYDLKLGNILLHEIPADECIEVRVGRTIFKVELKIGDLAAKLNDFGTSRTDSLPDENDRRAQDRYNPRGKTAKTLLSLDDDVLQGMDIDSNFYFSFILAATLEYSAMEMLYRGDNALLDQTIDFFHLGYCLFNLGAGKDFLEAVPIACPKGVNSWLQEFWSTSSRFSVLRQWPSGPEKDYSMFADALYRHLVVFGGCGGEDDPWVVFGCHGVEEAEMANVVLGSFRNNRDDWKQYKKDRCLYNIDNGTALQAAREKWTPAGIDLIKGLCHVNPDKRTTLLKALHSPYMARFKTMD